VQGSRVSWLQSHGLKLREFNAVATEFLAKLFDLVGRNTQQGA
jgi:hypothetical protein